MTKLDVAVVVTLLVAALVLFVVMGGVDTLPWSRLPNLVGR